MSLTENTHLKNVTPAAGDSNPSVEIGIMQGNTYQHPVLIVAGSLLTLLVWIAATGKSSASYHLTPSVHEMTDNAGALTDYQVDTAESVFVKDIFAKTVETTGCTSHDYDGNCCEICCHDLICCCGSGSVVGSGLTVYCCGSIPGCC